MAKNSSDPIPIKCPNLIICEGSADKVLLEKIIKNNTDFQGKFQIHSAGGVYNINNTLIKTFKLSEGFEKLKSLIIVIDSDDDPKKASQKIKEIFRVAGFPVPNKACAVANSVDNTSNIKKTAYVLFPKLDSDETKGTLENLCLEILSESLEKARILGIADEAIAQVGTLKKPHKNRLYTYLSLTDDVEKSLATAIESDAFDCCSQKLNPFIDLLHSIDG